MIPFLATESVPSSRIKRLKYELNSLWLDSPYFNSHLKIILQKKKTNKKQTSKKILKGVKYYSVYILSPPTPPLFFTESVIKKPIFSISI